MLDIGVNRIRIGCRNSPIYSSAFCESCAKNLVSRKGHMSLEKDVRVSYLAELYEVGYLKQNEYFIEAIEGCRYGEL